MHLLAVLSMKNRALIALITVVIALFGGYALTALKQELAPDIQFPQLAILTTYPGASPAVVTNDVSTPIEAAIQGVPNLQSTSAVSSTNQSLITAMFTYGSDLDTAEQKIDQAINNIKSNLPSNVQPQVLSGSISDLPVIELAVSSSQGQNALAANVDKLAVPELQDVDGVDGAQVIGAAGKRVTITPDAAKLAAAGLTAESITTALTQNGALVPGGSITENGKTLSVQAGTQITSLAQLRAVPLLPAAGTAGAAAATGGASGAAAGAASVGAEAAPSTIGDVATVVEDNDPVTSISRVNGKPALTIAVTKLPSANTVAVSKGVRADIKDIEAKLGDGAKITVVFDQAPFIEQSISSLAEEGLLGLGFAVIVILLFLLSVRATLVTAISIPTSVLITFIGILSFGYTLNIITLGGLTIAIGRVVDDSIVVIENIKRHLVPGADRAATVLLGVREVAGAITASTITTVAVFLPIAFVGDVTGELFRPFALTVTIALLSSLLVALTIVPVLAYWFVRPPRAKKHEAGHEPEEAATPAHATPLPAADATADATADPNPGAAVAVGGEVAASAGRASADDLEHPTRLQRGYLPIIHWTIKHSALTIVFALVVLAGSAALIPVMQTNFLGSTGQNTMTVTQTLPPGASLGAQDTASRAVEKKLLGTPGIQTVQLSIGTSGNALEDAFGGGGGGINFSITTDPSADQAKLQTTVQNELKHLTGVGEIDVSASSGFGVSSNLEVDITASTQGELQTATNRITNALTRQSSLKQVSNNLAASLPYLAVEVDRGKAAAVGLSEIEVSQLVSQAMQPTQVGTMAIDENTLDIYVQSQDPPTTVAQLSGLSIPTAGGVIPLSSIATVSQVEGPATITTQKGLRSSAVTATPATNNLATANSAVSAVLADTRLPPGATAVVGGVTSSQGSAFSQLGIALLAAILIVYIVMVATFRSLRQPLLLLVSIPFAATGAILLQIISGIPLGVASLIGVLMLIGIVVTNAIVLVDLINQYRRRGLSVADAVLHGASRRLRPILMTALATIFALIPMAIGVTGGGGFISQPLAIVVIGGLVTSTILTLVVLPTLYNLVEGARGRRAERRSVRTNGRTGSTTPFRAAEGVDSVKR